MTKFLALLIIILVAIFSLAGCAGLGEIISEIPQTDATAEIGAVKVIVDDFVTEPYQTSIILGLGYALALLRRWYKKKKGSKG